MQGINMNNPNNRLITREEVEGILNYFSPIGNKGEMLKINDLSFYQRAFIHESYHQAVQNYINNPNETIPIYLDYISKESSERLEYLGDHVLKTTLGRYLYERFPDEREGFLTRLKIKIEKCSMLHKFAVTLGFKKFLLLSLQIENQTILGSSDRGRDTPSYYEDAFESFLGAIMEDFGELGYIYADRFVRNIIENVVDFSQLISTNDNFKDSLQRFFQNIRWATPVYVNLNQQGPLYRKVFTRVLYLTSDQFSQLSQTQQKSIKKYTFECLEYYKKTNPQVFTELSDAVAQGKFILCLGSQRKVTSSEQMAAKQGLINLNLDLDF
jgi:dsRNA-specific ribonuclease